MYTQEMVSCRHDVMWKYKIWYPLVAAQCTEAISCVSSWSQCWLGAGAAGAAQHHERWWMGCWTSGKRLRFKSPRAASTGFHTEEAEIPCNPCRRGGLTDCQTGHGQPTCARSSPGSDLHSWSALLEPSPSDTRSLLILRWASVSQHVLCSSLSSESNLSFFKAQFRGHVLCKVIPSSDLSQYCSSFYHSESSLRLRLGL